MFVEICFVFGALSILQLTNASVPDECKGLNYCTVKPDDYPQELFNSMFRGKFKEPVFQPTLVTSEARQADEEVGNCESRITFEPLYTVRSNQGNWHTVVQAPEENYSQLVRIEACVRPRSSCFTDLSGHIDVTAPFCEQQYNLWEFLVHDGESGTKKVSVELPVCCSCFYKSIFYEAVLVNNSP